MTTCDSCGRDEPAVWAVHRQYPSPDTGPDHWRTVDEIEQWCAACCAHFPHRPVD